MATSISFASSYASASSIAVASFVTRAFSVRTAGASGTGSGSSFSRISRRSARRAAMSSCACEARLSLSTCSALTLRLRMFSRFWTRVWRLPSSFSPSAMRLRPSSAARMLRSRRNFSRSARFRCESASPPFSEARRRASRALASSSLARAAASSAFFLCWAIRSSVSRIFRSRSSTSSAREETAGSTRTAATSAAKNARVPIRRPPSWRPRRRRAPSWPSRARRGHP